MVHASMWIQLLISPPRRRLKQEIRQQRDQIEPNAESSR
ncbi:hypothetical protein SynNOUM97013_01015 [Synechococcus sp. NOUM97013]|nr:hypothetical protein SynNOUM97013_01015 [Synechococcus sp. NOUM97013]